MTKKKNNHCYFIFYNIKLKLILFSIEDYNLEDVQCIETFQHLLQELYEKTNISRLELLQRTLFVLKRKDLINIAKSYRKMQPSTLHCVSEGIYGLYFIVNLFLFLFFFCMFFFLFIFAILPDMYK